MSDPKIKTVAQWGRVKDAVALLRFVIDDGMECQAGCREGGDGLPAFAIHKIESVALCATHSPFPNVFVPCTKCGVKPCERPESVEEDPMCLDCIRAVIQEIADNSMGAFTVVE